MKKKFITLFFEKYYVSFNVNNKIIHNFFRKNKCEGERMSKLKMMCIYNFYVINNM